MFELDISYRFPCWKESMNVMRRPQKHFLKMCCVPIFINTLIFGKERFLQQNTFQYDHAVSRRAKLPPFLPMASQKSDVGSCWRSVLSPLRDKSSLEIVSATGPMSSQPAPPTRHTWTQPVRRMRSASYLANAVPNGIGQAKN